MLQRIKTYCVEIGHDFWTGALRPTLQDRWKSIVIWTLSLGMGIPYAWLGFQRGMAAVLEDFLKHPPETQQQIIQSLFATPPPLWETLGVNVVIVFCFVWMFKTIFAPFRVIAIHAARAIPHHEKESV